MNSIYNIMVRVQAQRALSTLNAIKMSLADITTNGVAAGEVLDALSGAARGYTAALGGASAEAAKLSKSLAQINRSGGKVAAKLTDIGVGAELAGSGMAGMVQSARALSAVMGPLAVQTTVTANSLRVIGKVAAQSAVQQARADAIREQSAAKTAAAVSAAAQKEEAARAKAAAAAAADAAKVGTAQARETKATAEASAAVTKAEEAKQAARIRTAAVAATAAAQIAAAEARQVAASQAAAAATARAQAAQAAAAGATAVPGGMAGIANTMDNAGRAMQKFGSRVQWVGRQLAVNITFPIAAIGAAATKMYYDQEQAFTYLAKVYNGAQSDLGDFGGEVGRVTEAMNMMSTYFGINREEVYTVAEAWASLGMTGGSLAQSIQNTIETSLIGNMDLETATRSLIAVQAQFRLSTLGAREAIMQMNAIANEGPTELGPLTEAMARAGAAAHTAGLSVAETAGLIEALAPATGTATQAGNGLKSIIQSVMNPTNKAAELFDLLGINTARWAEESVPLIQRLQEMSDKFVQLTDPGQVKMVNELAGKFQFGRLTQILTDIRDPLGEFQKALRAAGEEATRAGKPLQVYEKELNRLLDSDFISFNRAWQMIKNSMVDAIKPAIPSILMLINTIAGLIRRFSELSPTTRKWIFTIALVLAIVGPLVMMLSTMVLLIGVLGIAFARVGPKILGFGKILLWALSLGRLFRNNGITRGVATIGTRFAQVSAVIARVWHWLWMGQIGRVAIGGVRANSGIINRFLAWMATAWVAMSGAVARRWAAMWAAMTATSVAGGAANAGIFSRMWRAMMTVAMVGGRGIWRAFNMVFLGIPGLLARGLGAVGSVLMRFLIAPVVSAIGAAATAIAAFVGLPVWAVAAIIAAVVAAGYAIWRWRDQIGKAIVSIIRFFALLPGRIIQALVRILRAVLDFGKRILTALRRALNPFERHSPSLVDNVIAGTDIIRGAYNNLADDVIADMIRAQAAVSRFGAASRGIVSTSEELQYQDKRADVARVSPAAAAEMDSLRTQQKILERDVERVSQAIAEQERVIKRWEAAIEAADKQIEQLNDELDAMQKAADATSKQLDAAKERLAEYTEANIEGEGAMSDAIFANEMAQKRLRLEIMKLEDAAGPIDDIRDKYQRLQGDIDTLTGKRDQLRAMGAGSDVLGTYDAMIADLQRQQGELATEDVSKIEQAQKELERLQREGEKLDLENSLKFDPLNRQIEKMTSNVKEMPFDQIVSGIQRESAAVESLTALHESQNAAIEAQQSKIEAATAARDAMADSMEVEQEKLDALNELQGGLRDQLDEVTSAMDVTVGAAQDLTQRQEEAAEAAAKAAEEFAEEQAKLDDLAKSAEEAGKAVEGVGGGMDWAFADQMDEDLLPKPEDMGIEDWMDDFESQFNNALSDFELDLNPFDNMWEGIKNFFRMRWEQFLGHWKGWWASLKNAIGNIGDWLADAAASVGRFFSELPGKVTGFLSEVWGSITSWASNTGSSVGSFFTGLWNNHIWPALSTWPGKLGEFFAQLPTRLVEGFGYLIGFIVGMFARAITESVQAMHTAAVGIWSFFEQLPSRVLGFLMGLGNMLGQLFADAITWSVQTIWNVGSGIYGWFEQLPARILGALQSLGTWLGQLFADAISWSVTTIHNTGQAIYSWFEQLPSRLLGYLLGFGRMLGDWIMNAIRALNGDAETAAERLYRWFIELPTKLILFLRDFPGMMAAKGLEIVQGLYQGFMDALFGVGDWLREHLVNPIIDGIKDGFEIFSPSHVMMRMGVDIVQGMINGIGSMAGALWTFVKDFFKRNVIDKAKEIFGISSPSTVMYGVGQDTGQGWVDGIESKGPEVSMAVQGLSDRITSMPLPPVDSSKVMEDFSAATGDARSKVDILAQGLQSYIGQATSTQTSQILLNDAIKAGNDQIGAMPGNLGALSGALLTAGGHIDVSSDQGRRLHDTLVGVAGQYGAAGNAAIQAALAQGQSNQQALDAALNAGSGIRGSLEATLTQMGLNSGQAKALADQYLGMVREYWTQLMLNKTVAQQQLDEFKAQNYFMDVQMRLKPPPPGSVPPPPETQPRDLSPVPYKASGGWISGPGTGTSDSILAAVSNGEFVVNAKMAQKYSALLEAINSGRELPAFALGGLVGAAQAAIGGAQAQLTGQASVMVQSPVGQLPRQLQEATAAATQIVQTYIGQNTAQLEQVRTKFQTTYDQIKSQVMTKMQELGFGQIQLQEFNNSLLLQGQAAFNGATIGATLSMKDGVLSLNGQMHAGAVAINGQMRADVTGITAQMQADVNGIQTQLQVNATAINDQMRANVTSINADMNAQVNKGIYDSANYQGQVMTTNRDNLNNLTANARDLVTGNFNQMSTNLANTFNSGIKPTFDAFNPMLTTTQGWFDSAATGIGQIWERVRPATADPSRFIINDVYNGGIRQAWNKVNGWLGLPPLDEFIAPFATGGPLERATDITRGGRLHGPPTGDKKLFRGNGNEYVLTKPMVDTIGYSKLEQMRHASNAGRRLQEGAPHTVPGFALGGPVDTSLWNAAKTAFPNATLNSAHRPGDSGFHGKAQAVDLGGPMQQIADWIFTTYPDSAQLIWGPGPSSYFGNRNQAEVRSIYTEATMAEHYDHVHWAHTSPISSDGKMISAAAGTAGAAYVSMVSRVEKEYRGVMDEVKKKLPNGIPGTVGQYPIKGYEKFDTEVWKFLKGKAEAIDAVMAASGVTMGPLGGNSMDYAREIANAAKERGLEKRAARIGIATGLVESELRMLANYAVPESLSYPHDGIGSDHDSIGIFQQRNSGWGTVAQRMNARASAGMFYNKLMSFDWRAMEDGAAAQRVQVSAYPGKYSQRMGQADAIANQVYDTGGWLQPGVTTAVNATTRPEPILTDEQWQQIRLMARGSASLVKNFGKAVAWGVGRIFGPNPITDWIKNMIGKLPWPGGGGPGGGTGGGGTGPGGGTGGGTTPPVPPKAFWADAAAQMKTWTPDLAAPIEGLEGVVANLPRKVDEVVVPEWPPMPEIPEVVVPPIEVPEPPEPPDIPPVPPVPPTTPPPDTAPVEEASKKLTASLKLVDGKLVGSIEYAGKKLEGSAEIVNGKLVANAEYTSDKLTATVDYADGKITGSVQTAAGQITADANIQHVIDQYGAGVNGTPAVVASARSAELNVSADANGNIKATATTPNGTVTATATVAPGGDTVTININGNLEFPNVTGQGDVQAFINQLKTAAGR